VCEYEYEIGFSSDEDGVPQKKAVMTLLMQVKVKTMKFLVIKHPLAKKIGLFHVVFHVLFSGPCAPGGHNPTRDLFHPW
jgi:hypothetical protein